MCIFLCVCVCVRFCLEGFRKKRMQTQEKTVPTTFFPFSRKGHVNFIYNPLKKSLLKNANLIQSKKTFNLDLADRIMDKYKILHK